MATKLPQPATMFRVSTVAFLAAAAIPIIMARVTGAGWGRELSGFFIVPFLAFGLFFVEYNVVQGVATVRLNFSLGYVQWLGCVAIVLWGVVRILSARWNGDPQPPAISESVLVLLGVFGHLAFLTNIFWSYFEQDVPKMRPPANRAAAVSQPAIQQRRIDTLKPPNFSGWPRSPVILFGVTAAFFAGMAIYFSAVGALAPRLPLPWHGHVSQVRAGYLWMLTALPFGVFSLVYWGIERGAGRIFDVSTTRVHFVCTLLAVVETIRVYINWASSLINPGGLEHAVALSSFNGVFAFAVLASLAFAWNLWTSTRKLAHAKPLK